MRKIVLVFLVLCLIHFWGFAYIPEWLFQITDVIALLVLFVVFLKGLQLERLRFKWVIILYLIGILCNILSAYFNNQQAIKDTFINFIPYLFILFYFFLHDRQHERKELENVIIVFAILYGAFYLFQENVYPDRFFNGPMYRDRGTIRMRIEGNGFLMLGYFLLINRFLLERKIYQVVIAFIFFIILFKTGFRTMAAAAVVLTGIVFLKLVKYSAMNYFLIIAAVFVFLGMMQFGPTSRIIDGMLNASEEEKMEQEMGKTNIRLIAYEFITKEYPKNFSYYIVGGGLPGSGSYAQYMQSYVSQFGIFWVDLGLIGFYYVIGLIALLGLAFWAIKAIFIKLPPDSLYLNMYFAYLVLVSFTTVEIFRNGIFVVEAIALYLIDLARDEKLGLNQQQDSA